jgi:hypothetical protein
LLTKKSSLNEKLFDGVKVGKTAVLLIFFVTASHALADSQGA